MPIQEHRLKMRHDIRMEQVQAKEIPVLKLRQKLTSGWMPSTKEELADILKMVHDHAKHLGYAEECKEIMEKLSEEAPMTMEKYGVECRNDHDPAKPYMEKLASGDVKCKHCGKKFGTVTVEDKVGVKDEVKGQKGTIERMLNME
jgi:hypothetical protein